MQKNLQPPSVTPSVSSPKPDFDFDEKELKFPEEQARRRSYRAALALTGRIIPLPIVVAFITALVYIAPPSGLPLIGSPDSIGAIIYGLVITAIIWLLTSLFCMDITTFAGANEQSSNHIKRHLLNLYSVLHLIKEKTDPDSKGYSASSSLVAFRNKSPDDYDLALRCVYQNVCGANKQLHDRDTQVWLRGTGYLKVWNFIHIAEEALLNIVPREFVIREALHDEAAINGSGIALHDTVLSNIKTAVKTLSPSAGIYLKSLPAQDRNISLCNESTNHYTAHAPQEDASAGEHKSITANTANTSVTSRDSSPDAGAASANPIKRLFSRPNPGNHSTSTTNGHKRDEELDAVTEMEARNALRDARQTLNDFRASQWDGLVRLRNQIYGTSLFTAILTYALLCAAIISGVYEPQLKAALFFYLIGATVGLFSRLYTERQSDNAIDDYGLTIARVMVTPIVSGVAAIAGVLVISLLSLNLFNTPGDKTNVGLPSLKLVYDLVANQQGIIIAAIFGFAPNLLLNALQQKANDATTKLKNSTAPGGEN